MLEGKRIAVPENRQLDILARLLEARGAQVLRVPLVAIHDAPDPAPVLAWLRAFITDPPALFILLTGEGLRRLLDLAEREGLREDFVRALAAVPRLCRGPKPVRALNEVGIKGEIPAQAPTTEGVIATLETLPLEGRRVAVQLYGQDPNLRLTDYLRERGAELLPVAPYVYADKSEEEQVLRLLDALAQGGLDVIAFTSQPQYRRLAQVARAQGREEDLRQGLARTRVAAVGPVVRDQLQEAGVRVDIMPERAYFMKPLVTAILRHFDPEAAADA